MQAYHLTKSDPVEGVFLWNLGNFLEQQISKMALKKFLCQMHKVGYGKAAPLILFMPLVSFYSPWKHEKISGYLVFSRGVESLNST